MVTVDEVRKAQRAEGTATIMAIGTANPPNVYDQSSYPDTYFRMTNTEHMTQLLGLDLSINRVMLYQQGCNGGGTVLRIAKDLAENNKGVRVLIVCTEITLIGFHCPTEIDVDLLVSHSLFADGSAALIVGADLIPGVENPIFELISTTPTLVPNSPGAICGSIREHGLTFHIGKEAAHPGGPAILDQVEAKLGLKLEKLRATRHVLAEYGNMSSVTVFFILDEVRKKSTEDGLKTTGEGSEWGVLFGFGPGLTIETLVLHSVKIA
ncbi:hypothetical protein Pint_13505 [Pistacia integerrima]|uniref:Uncharacterized protein n=1 Tax=Pistacia integerrima TaxID=434235 RepID=A0ACC0Y8V9_9ROSI|nr:hypothetical protein Pint_13505 [Pistacia integerrima]